MEIFNKDIAEGRRRTSLPLTLFILLIAVRRRSSPPASRCCWRSPACSARWASSARSASSPRSTSSINHVILLIGLAVGVDYALFYLRREREERAAGRSKEAALEAAAATSGRAVLVSGFTVMIAMAGMYLAGDADVHVVRDRHDPRRRRGDARLAHRAARAAVDARRQASTSGRVPRSRPAQGAARPSSASGRASSTGCSSARSLSAVVAAALLVALAHPRARHEDRRAGHCDSLPQDMPGRADVQPPPGGVPQREHRGAASSSRAPTSRRRRSRPASTSSRRGHRRGQGPVPRRASTSRSARTRRWPRSTVPIAGDGTRRASETALDVLRDELVPATVGKVDGVEAVRRRRDRRGSRTSTTR